MDLAVGLFTIIAGAIYIMWQYHKEDPGGITTTMIIVAVVCAPLAFWNWIMNNVNVYVGITGLFAHIGVICYLMFSPRIEKKATESIIESAEIWQEVNALPIPDDETLNRYKIANKIPLYPPDSEVFRQQAIKYWRTHEYNQRFEQKHRFVFYTKI